MTEKQRLLILLALSLIFNFTAWGLIYFKIPQENFPFIIKYNIFLGKDLFGEKLSLFLLPGLGLIIFIINAILSLSLLSKQESLASLIAGANFFWQFFILFYAFSAIFINTY
jgi:hypothetical protein